MRLFFALLFACCVVVSPALAAPVAAAPEHTLWLAEAIAGFAVMTLAIFVFAAKTEVLRESDPVDFPGAPLAKPPLAPIALKRPFSLAQSQMTWWFWIIASSFAYLAILNRDIGGGLNQESLILLGIGAGTAVGSELIDQSRGDKGAQLNKYNAAWDQLVNPTTTTSKFDDPYAVMQEAAKALQSDGFLQDILSDANGVSLHRFQSVAWTVVLGIIFLYNVLAQGTTMPTLTTLELSLLGISAGTYLGLKIPEKLT